MNEDKINIKDPMIEMFIFESQQLVEQLEEIILNVEKSNALTKDEINEIFRIMHTIKGSSAMMMYNNISLVAHSLEDLFYYFRENKDGDINCSAVCEEVFKGIDFIKSEILKIQQGKDEAADGQVITESIRQYLSNIKDKHNTDITEDKQNVKPKKQQYYISSDKSLLKQNNNVKQYFAQVYFEDGCQMENIRAFTLIHNIKDLCSDIKYIPEDIEDNASAEYIVKNGFKIYFSSYKSKEELDAIINSTLFLKQFSLISEEDMEFQEKNSEYSIKNDDDAVLTFIEEHNKENNKVNIENNKQNLISVNVKKLDKLMDLVGEIVITEAMVTKNPDLKGLALENFEKTARQLRKLTDELQDIVMSIRMLPVAATFHKMQRLVRDMSKKLNKEVELEIIGEDTEVDKSIIDNLSDPLMHIIRNSMDHGIEDEEERVKRKKSRKGIIRLSAENSGSDVVITVTDDGKGLDKKKILEKAVQNGLIARPEKDMTEREIFSLILLPGFSTKENVTEFSGRGVGMDVVKRDVEKLGGTVNIQSEEGKGTTIILKIPLTLAIIEGMEIEVGNNIYTIPIMSIRESFRPSKKEVIEDPDGNEMIMIRGNCYPVLRLSEFFKITTQVKDLSEGIIIVVEAENKSLCLFADRLLGEQQVVVKPLPAYITRYVGRLKGIGGCTILGNGNISLIMDVNSLF